MFNREILFRGKRVQNGGWCVGYLVQSGRNWTPMYEKLTKIVYPDIYGFVWNEVIPETIGQYTGLKDRNDKRIFEGDIVRGKDNLEKALEVYGYISHENGSFVIVGELMTHYRWLDYDVEVIGNIHDNPELLER